MKLKFKHQPFQAEAAAAVCDVPTLGASGVVGV